MIWGRAWNSFLGYEQRHLRSCQVTDLYAGRPQWRVPGIFDATFLWRPHKSGNPTIKENFYSKETSVWGSLLWKVCFTAHSDITCYHCSEPWGQDGDKKKSIKWSITCLDRHRTSQPFCIYPVTISSCSVILVPSTVCPFTGHPAAHKVNYVSLSLTL